MTEYQWRVGDVFTDGQYRWKVEEVISGGRARLRSCDTSWATTEFLTYADWNDRGQWTLEVVR